MSRIIRKVALVIKAIKLIKNWYQIKSLLYSKNEKGVIIELRTGPKFYVSDNIFDIYTLLEIFAKMNQHDYLKFTSLPKNPIVIDLGANIGAFSIVVVKKYPHSKIYCFEPDKRNFKKLIKNLEVNNIKNCDVFENAVGKVNGRVLLYSEEEKEFGTAGSSLFKTNAQSIQVSCITLDKIFLNNKIEMCDFLKIDVEGSEYDILFNASRETLQKIKSMSIEYHEINDHKIEELVMFLNKYGFKTSAIKSKKNINFGFLYANS